MNQLCEAKAIWETQEKTKTRSEQRTIEQQQRRRITLSARDAVCVTSFKKKQPADSAALFFFFQLLKTMTQWRFTLEYQLKTKTTKKILPVKLYITMN